MICASPKALPCPHGHTPLPDTRKSRRISRWSSWANATSAFTMVELMVATAVLVVLLVLAAQIIDRTSRVWTDASSKMEQFREARIGFDALIEHLNKATLDQYFGYTYKVQASGLTFTSGANTIKVLYQAPQYFGRRSELRFICGSGSNLFNGTTLAPQCPTDCVFFTAPLGITSSGSYARLPGLLNLCGYYIQWSNVDPELPSILTGKTVNGTTLSGSNGNYRFRLMQFVQPAENMTLYSVTTGTASQNTTKAQTNTPSYTFVQTPGWYYNAMQNSPASARPVANNVVALLLLPAMTTSDTSGALVSGTVDGGMNSPFTYDSELNGNSAKNGNPSALSPATNPFNRLPPVIRVVLYTIDEVSAKKLQNSPTMPNLYQYQSQNLFQDPSILYPTMNGSAVTDVGDLARFETVLTQNQLTFRRFEAAVQLPQQPWSTQPDF